MNKLLNVNQELQKLEYNIQRIHKCTKSLELLKKEQIAKEQSNQMLLMVLVSTIYALAMICVRVIRGDELLDSFVYIALAIFSSLLIFMLTNSFPTKHMKNIGSICMIAVALASITPVLPDLMYQQFSSVPTVVAALVRIISMPVLIIAWIKTLSGDRNRNQRLKEIWKDIREG